MLSQVILDEIVQTLNICNLDGLSIPEFIKMVEGLQINVVKKLNLPDIQIRRLDAKVIESLLEKMKTGQGIQWVMRHGEQDPGPVISAFLDEALKKITMMQKEHNETDPITISSAIEFIGTALTLRYFKENTGYEIEIEHSGNLRAQQPAEILARALQITPVSSPVLTCVNYKENDELDRAQLDQKGSLTSTSQLAAVLVDLDAFEQNMREMAVQAEQPLKKKTIKVSFTHTKQINQFHAQATKTGKPAGRLANYGHVYRDESNTVCYQDGCYSQEKRTLSAKQADEKEARVSSAGFFGKPVVPEFANVDALRTGSLEFYLSQINSFDVIWRHLQEKCKADKLFAGEPPVNYNMENFLKDYFKTANPDLDKTAFQSLAEPLSTEVAAPPLALLSDEIECYIDLLGDARENKLSKLPYGENVDETQHADQAGKISAKLGMHSEDIVSLLFHDIARCAVEKIDIKNSHAKHAQEGGDILAPLGITIDYARYHAVAKHLLYHCCPAYKDLISPTSDESLKIQEKELVRELKDLYELYKLEPLKLATTLYQIMFMRLIDDLSKVPPSELKKHLGVDADYYIKDQIRMMLRKQMTMHLKQEKIDPDMEEKL